MNSSPLGPYIGAGSIVLGMVLLAGKKEHILGAIIYFCAIINAILCAFALFKLWGVAPNEYQARSPIPDSWGWWADCFMFAFLVLGPPWLYYVRWFVVSDIIIGIYKIHNSLEKVALRSFELFCFICAILFLYGAFLSVNYVS